MRIILSVILLFPSAGWPYYQSASQNSVSAARDLIRQQRYNDAITRIEQILEKTPEQPDALELMGAAFLYSEHDFLKAKGFFERAIRAGGGAIFWVSHSHEKLGTDELADYCRGWLYIRKTGLEFVPDNGDHAFRLAYSEVKEFKQNRMAKSLFHIKDSNRNFNFRPRTGDESEVMLALVMYQKLSQ
jgi:tetratricopeptide (TPR) repeat protein